MGVETNNGGDKNRNGWDPEKTPKGNSVVTPFEGILSTQSLMSLNNNVVELKDIKKNIEEQLANQRRTVINDANRASIPNVLDMSSEQSPNLPGVIFYCISGTNVYLMPVLFYKKGANSSLEVVGISDNNAPTFSKFAESFANEEMRTKVKAAFTKFKDKVMTSVKIVTTYVVDLDQYFGATKDTDLAVVNVGTAVLREWYNAMYNYTIMEFAAYNRTQNENNQKVLPSLFKGNKLLGPDSTAVVRIDVPQNPLIMEGRPAPYNLLARLATAVRGNAYNQNLNNIKSVATTYLNVTLEVMTSEGYRVANSMNMTGQTRGPLVPVISLGKTVPGEQLQNNDSILNMFLGIFIMLGANNPIFFTEALRQQQVGVRGSLVNLAEAAYRVSGRRPANEDILTTKLMLNPKKVLQFMQSYISSKAVFVLDLPTYIESPSNAEFWWNFLTMKAVEGKKITDTTYYKAFIMMWDSLTNRGFSRYLEETKDDKTAWKIGDKVLEQSTVIIPTGTAYMNNQIFNLEEVDQMFLRNPANYGDNEAAISTLVGLYNGACNKDMRTRQYEIKKMLEGLFAGNVDVTGWKSRWIFQDKFLNAVSRSMTGAGQVSTTSYGGTHAWETQVSNDYLSQVTTAVIMSGPVHTTFNGNIGNNWPT